MLACLYFRQLGEARHAILKAVALAAAYSLVMEIAQLFVPNRVASAIDLACNAGGALLGALVFADPLYSVVTRQLGDVRERLVIPGAWGDAGLVLLMLWLLAQLNPALPFFGAGNIGGDGARRGRDPAMGGGGAWRSAASACSSPRWCRPSREPARDPGAAERRAVAQVRRRARCCCSRTSPTTG